jgi:hypothetical protein
LICNLNTISKDHRVVAKKLLMSSLSDAEKLLMSSLSDAEKLLMSSLSMLKNCEYQVCQMLKAANVKSVRC